MKRRGHATTIYIRKQMGGVLYLKIVLPCTVYTETYIAGNFPALVQILPLENCALYMHGIQSHTVHAAACMLVLIFPDILHAL